MSDKQFPAGLDIDSFANTSVEIIENMVKDYRSHMCALDFDNLFIDIIEKRGEIK